MNFGRQPIKYGYFDLVRDKSRQRVMRCGKLVLLSKGR
jgi:hypothetical protein